MFEKEGFDHLITYAFLLILHVAQADAGNRSLYLRGDPYETSDAVFGVKESLLVNLGSVDADTSGKYGVKEGTKLIKYDFVLVTESEAKALREEEAKKAMEALGRRMKLLEGVPVPDVD
jgi:hypothetical protein